MGNLMPVNNDVQAPQISNMYLDDTADVAEAKEAFHAEFKNVEAGGLMAKQAPAPVPRLPRSRLLLQTWSTLSPMSTTLSTPFHTTTCTTTPFPTWSTWSPMSTTLSRPSKLLSPTPFTPMLFPTTTLIPTHTMLCLSSTKPNQQLRSKNKS